jgi:protein-S-isoprenylcysteine O-methyltransferase Ste14
LASWILDACWATFAVVWIGSWLYNRRDAPPVAQRSDRRWFLVPIAAAAILTQIPPAAWSPITICDPRLQWGGAFLLIMGTAFAVRARFALGAMWSSTPLRRAGHELRTTGPYALTRHPIYTGIVAMLLGSALIDGLGILVPFAGAAIAGLAMKIRAEERLMRSEFGEEYDRYARRVPALIPRPWPRG